MSTSQRIGSVFCVLSILSSAFACESTDECGDGIVDSGEDCDDGNLASGDGCSSSCRLDDNLSTRGDDRAGYLSCTDTSTGESTTCGPGLGCCTGGALCRASLEACATPFDFVSCDGPEDCADGEKCWLEARAVGCSSTPTPYFFVFCHTDADCVDSDVNPCIHGQCFGAPDQIGDATTP